MTTAHHDKQARQWRELATLSPVASTRRRAARHAREHEAAARAQRSQDDAASSPVSAAPTEPSDSLLARLSTRFKVTPQRIR